MAGPEDQIAQLGEQLAQLTQVVTALAQVQNQPLAPAPAPVEPADDGVDVMREIQEMKDDRRAQAQRMKEADKIAVELLEEILQPRDFEVMDWARGEAGHATFVQFVVRQFIGTKKAEYREAMGLIGSSSKNSQTLVNSLTPAALVPDK